MAEKWSDLPQAHICWETKAGWLVVPRPGQQAGYAHWRFPSQGLLWLIQQLSIWRVHCFSPFPNKTSDIALTKRFIPDTVPRWYQGSKCKTGFPAIPLAKHEYILQISFSHLQTCQCHNWSSKKINKKKKPAHILIRQRTDVALTQLQFWMHKKEKQPRSVIKWDLELLTKRT